MIALEKEDVSSDGLILLLLAFCLVLFFLRPVSRESSNSGERFWLLVLSLPESLKVSLTEDDALGSDHPFWPVGIALSNGFMSLIRVGLHG